MPGVEYKAENDWAQLKFIVLLTIILTCGCGVIFGGVPTLNEILNSLGNSDPNSSTNWNPDPGPDYNLGQSNTQVSPNNLNSGGFRASDGGGWDDECDNLFQNALNPDCRSWPP